MKRRDLLRLAGTGAALSFDSHFGWGAAIDALSPKRPPVPASPFDVGTRSQLFVDRFLVREAQNISFSPHLAEKYRQNPVVVRDKPWEGWDLEIYGSVLFDSDEKIFKMWYRGGKNPSWFSSAEYTTTLYAVSHDGVTWEKPLVGTIPCAKLGMMTNAVAYACAITSVLQDGKAADPGRRYKMVCMEEVQQAYHTKISPDGLHWRPLSQKPICAGTDVITAYYDDQRQLYVAFPKIMTQWRGFKRRVFYVITSPDFEHWSEPQLAWAPDAQDDAGSSERLEEVRPLLSVPDNPELIRTEFYGVGAYPQESCTLAFPWLFTINNNAPNKGPNEGPIEVQLGISRDLIHWERPFRLPCVPRGNPGDWDDGLIVTSSQAIPVGDEIWLYYSGENHTHGAPCVYLKSLSPGDECKGGIGLVKWKLDRFVSADGPREGGTLTTIPIAYSGSRLEINARTNSGGKMTVELLHPGGRVIDNVGLSEVFTGDDLRHRVRWAGDPEAVSRLAGQAICLRFHIQDGELYSFAFRTTRE